MQIRFMRLSSLVGSSQKYRDVSGPRTLNVLCCESRILFPVERTAVFHFRPYLLPPHPLPLLCLFLSLDPTSHQLIVRVCLFAHTNNNNKMMF